LVDEQQYQNIRLESNSIKHTTARKQFTQDVTPGFVYVLAVFSAIGGFLFGYDTGVISGAMLLLKRELGLSALWQEVLISSTVAAAALSALLGGFLNGLFGRRVCILSASFFFTVGGIVLSAAPGKEVLLAGRLIVGVGLGIASMTVPVYIAEASPPHLRGQLVTVNMLFVTAGQFTASLIDGAFSYLQHNGWRYMLGLSVIPAVLQFVGFLFLPESPRQTCPQSDRGNQNIDEEYDSIKNSIEEEEKDSGGDGPVIWRMLTYPPTRRALIVGCGLQMFQQLSGINTVMFCLKFPTGTCLSLSLLAVGFLISAQHSPPITFHSLDPATANSTCSNYHCGFCYRDNGSVLLTTSCVPVNKASTEHAAWGRCSNASQMKEHTYWAYNYCPTSYSWLVLLGLVLYLAAFAPGMGPISTGNACAAGVNWTFNILVSLTFLHLAQYLTYYGTSFFFLYSSLALLGLIFIFGCLPETKGRRLEEIEALFENQLCSCGVSDSDEGRQVEYIRVKGSNYHLSDNDASDVE
uniref:Solute carrier family 2 member 13 n=1 Tax=Neogobius melanostomus TaxID=47308 RepID=A0A8C6V2L6_9GOBI